MASDLPSSKDLVLSLLRFQLQHMDNLAIEIKMIRGEDPCGKAIEKIHAAAPSGIEYTGIDQLS